MSAPTVELGGIVLRAPFTAGTDALLAAQCGLFFLSCRGAAKTRTRLWAGFFLFMAVSTLAGAWKHGFPHYGPDGLLTVVVLASGLASGLSTYHAQRALLASDVVPVRHRDRLLAVARGQLLVFAVVAVQVRTIGPVLANTAVGLLPVTAGELVRFRAGGRGSGWVLAGLAVSSLTAAAYLLRLSLGPWVDHVGIAHVLMMASLHLIWRGVRPESPAAPVPSLPPSAPVKARIP